MNANDKTEKVLREIHIMLSKAEPYKPEPVYRKSFFDILFVFMAIVMEGNELASYLSIRDVAITGRSR